MTTFSISVKTKDRSPGPNYLRATLENFARAGGFDSKHFAGMTVYDSSPRSNSWLSRELVGYPVSNDRTSEGRTLHQNAAAAIRGATRGKSTHVMVLEDDLDFCDKFLESAAKWLEDVAKIREFSMYALGANYSQIDSCKSIFWQYPVGAFYAAQALVWTRQTAAELGEWLGEDPHYNGQRSHGHDLLLQRWGKSLQQDFFAASAPSLVQHVGQVSGIGNKEFKFNSWRGRNWSYA